VVAVVVVVGTFFKVKLAVKDSMKTVNCPTSATRFKSLLMNVKSS